MKRKFAILLSAMLLMQAQQQHRVLLAEQVFKTEVLQQAAKLADYPLTLRLQPGYDHSYFFIASFIVLRKRAIYAYTQKA